MTVRAALTPLVGAALWASDIEKSEDGIVEVANPSLEPVIDKDE